MKIKLYNLLPLLTGDNTGILNKMAIKEFDDGVTSFRLMRNIKNIGAELGNFELVRETLVKRLGTKVGDNKVEVLPNTPEMEEYVKQCTALAQEEVEINILLLNPRHLKGFSPVELMIIDWMLMDETRQEEV